MPIPIERPYVAPPSSKCNHMTHCYERSIAYALQMRGDNDDIPTIIYYGVPFQLMYDVMKHMALCLQNQWKGYIIRNEHSCRYKNGKAYRRISVEIHGLNEYCISLPDVVMLINNYMQRICWCKIKEFSLTRLLNL